MILLIQWPNVVPTGMTPNRVALLVSLWVKNSLSPPVRIRTGPSSRAPVGSGRPIDPDLLVEVSMAIFTPL